MKQFTVLSNIILQVRFACTWNVIKHQSDCEFGRFQNWNVDFQECQKTAHCESKVKTLWWTINSLLELSLKWSAMRIGQTQPALSRLCVSVDSMVAGMTQYPAVVSHYCYTNSLPPLVGVNPTPSSPRYRCWNWPSFSECSRKRYFS